MNNNQINKEKCIISLSGLDSTTLLYYLIKKLNYEPENIYALLFNYGQNHNIEITYSKYHCDKLNVNYKIINMNVLGELIKNNCALVNKNLKIPHVKEILGLPTVPTEVGFRNGIFTLFMCAYAQDIKANKVYMGLMTPDEFSYWDTSPNAVQKLNDYIKLNRTFDIQLEAPFIHLQKSEIIKIGLELGVDYSKTWSCYKGPQYNEFKLDTPLPCLKCSSCAIRTKGFIENNTRDPLISEEKWKEIVK